MSKVKVTMGIIDNCLVRGDATVCVVLFIYIDHITKTVYAKKFRLTDTVASPAMLNVFSSDSVRLLHPDDRQV